jgi:hypothetical protein
MKLLGEYLQILSRSFGFNFVNSVENRDEITGSFAIPALRFSSPD